MGVGLLFGLAAIVASAGHERRAKDKLRSAVSGAVGIKWTSELIVRQKLVADGYVLDYEAFHALMDACEAENLIVGQDAMPATTDTQRPPRQYRLVIVELRI